MAKRQADFCRDFTRALYIAGENASSSAYKKHPYRAKIYDFLSFYDKSLRIQNSVRAARKIAGAFKNILQEILDKISFWRYNDFVTGVQTP